jgi:D-3-phosphoglycerate dehydrogenase
VIRGKINILIADPVNKSGFSLLKKSKFTLLLNQGLDENGIIELSRKKNISVLVINSRRKIGRNFLSRCGFRAIATASRGTDHIDSEYADKRNIRIINSMSGNSVAATEHTFALILAAYKNLFISDKNVRNNKFDLRIFISRNLYGKKIGIIGFGQVGSKVGHLARVFGMDVYFNDIDPVVIRKYPKFIFLETEEIFRYCDIVTLHIPLNDRNINLIGQSYLSELKQNAVFVNTSRGAVVNEKELLEFLKHRRDVTAGLDVFCNEPGINKNFTPLKNTILTNHIAGKTEESGKFISDEIFKQVNKLFF